MIKFLRQHKLFYSVVAVLIFVSFAFNIFGLGPNSNWFGQFENFSEEIVRNTIKCSKQGEYKGNLVSPYSPAEGDCVVYPSQFGLQGYVYSYLSKLPISSEMLVVILKLLLVIAMTVTLALLVLFVHRRYGGVSASVVASFIMLSDWLAGFSANMYWVAFLMFLPFLFSLYAYPLIAKKKIKVWHYGLIIGLLLFLKFLTGYEYSTVIAISIASTILYWEFLLPKFNIKRVVKRVLMVAGISVVSLCMALTVHTTSLINDYGSINNALDAVTERGLARAEANDSNYKLVGLYNFISMNPEVYNLIDSYYDLDKLYDGESSDLVYLIVNVFSYLLLPVISLPIVIKGLVGVILGTFIFWLGFAFILLKVGRKKKLLKLNEYRSFFWAMIASLLGILSWFVLAPGHTYVHAHINAIMLYTPLVLWVYIIISVFFARLIKSLWLKRK